MLRIKHLLATFVVLFLISFFTHTTQSKSGFEYESVDYFNTSAFNVIQEIGFYLMDKNIGGNAGEVLSVRIQPSDDRLNVPEAIKYILNNADLTTLVKLKPFQVKKIKNRPKAITKALGKLLNEGGLGKAYKPALGMLAATTIFLRNEEGEESDNEDLEAEEDHPFSFFSGHLVSNDAKLDEDASYIVNFFVLYEKTEHELVILIQGLKN